MRGYGSAGIDRPKGKNIRSLGFLFQYLWPYRFAALGALIALCITSGAVLGLGAGLRYLIDEGLQKGDAALLDRAYFILLGVTLLLAAATFARFYLVSKIGEQVVADIRRDLFAHVLKLDIGFFETSMSGEIVSRLTTDTTLLQTLVGSSLSVAARNFLMLVGGILMLIHADLKLAGYMFLVVPLVVTPIILLGRKVRGLSRATQDQVAVLTSMSTEALGAIRTIQAYNLEHHEETLLSAQVKKALDTALTRIQSRAFLTAIVISLVFGAVMTVLWMGGKDVLTGELSAGALSSFIFYSVVVAGAVGALSEVAADFQRAAGATERLAELFAAEPEITARTQVPVPAREATGDLYFQHVAFAYPTRPGQEVLKEFSLHVPKGKSVALVGPSGAGKSTVFQLLLRFYDPTAGAILLGSTDVRDLDPSELRRHFALVPQDPVIFSGSVRANILCGNPEASEEEIRAAAVAANAWEFIDRLPEKLDTELGERGIRLSGGQRQRLAIARAVLRNPEILLLDEATSALDSENERLVQAALERLMEGRTTLVIAHRLSTVLQADQIVVMDYGMIAARGTHQELLKSNPLYARLAALQFEAAA